MNSPRALSTAALLFVSALVMTACSNNPYYGPAVYTPPPIVPYYGWGGAGYYGGAYYGTSAAYYNSSYYRGVNGAVYRTPYSSSAYYSNDRGGYGYSHDGPAVRTAPVGDRRPGATDRAVPLGIGEALPHGVTAPAAGMVLADAPVPSTADLHRTL